jgi:hypothetical protein
VCHLFSIASRCRDMILIGSSEWLYESKRFSSVRVLTHAMRNEFSSSVFARTPLLC